MDGITIKEFMKGEQIMFTWLILILFIIEGTRIAGRIIKEKRKERKYIKRVKNMEGGRPIKHFNGRCYW